MAANVEALAVCAGIPCSVCRCQCTTKLQKLMIYSTAKFITSSPALKLIKEMMLKFCSVPILAQVNSPLERSETGARNCHPNLIYFKKKFDLYGYRKRAPKSASTDAFI